MAVDASTSARGDLILKNLTKSYGDFSAVDDLSLVVPKGSFFALLGPSGCGKTTLGRTILRLIEPTEGDIIFEGKRINDLNIFSHHSKSFFI